MSDRRLRVPGSGGHKSGCWNQRTLWYLPCLYFGQGPRIVNCAVDFCFRLLTGLKSAVCCPLAICKLVCLFRSTADLNVWGGNRFFK